MRGLKAGKTAGCRTIPKMPSTAIDKNQRPMTGPNALPIRDVPRGWIAKRATRIATAAGRT